jgi:hypothetical protein
VRVVSCGAVLTLAIALSSAACSKTTTGGATAHCAGGKCDTWGNDDRHELHELPEYGQYAQGVGVLVFSSELHVAADGSAKLADTVSTLGAAQGLCEGVSFREQPTLGYCSGFFAGRDIFVTAGHCLKSDYSGNDPTATCAGTHVVFDFAYLSESQDPLGPVSHFPRENVYRCAEVVLADNDLSSMGYSNDMAIIRLDRPVEGREPLRFRHEGAIEVGQAVFQIGHPSGLPMKISLNGVVQPSWRSGQGSYELPVARDFYFDLEMFGGNSGGPTFSVDKGQVEGVAAAYSGQNWVEEARQGGACNVSGVCGVNVECPIYPGSYPITEYAALIDSLVGGPPAPSIGECRVKSPREISVVAGTPAEPVYGEVLVPGCTEGQQRCWAVRAQLGFGARSNDPSTSPDAFQWFPADHDPGQSGADSNGFAATPTTEYLSDGLAYAYRFSTDGGLHWSYCDTVGGASFDPAAMGTVTVR